MSDAITLQDIFEARRTISPWVQPTPLFPSPSLSRLTGASVYLKLETFHPTRAFKIRGATNRLNHLAAEERARGVVTVSTGNHGRAVANAAKLLGVRAVVCMSELVPRVKVEGVRALGAEVRIIGRSQDDAEVEANRLVEEEGLISVHPFDDRQVIAGQGTIGLELLETLPKIDCALVGLSGGGLISGIALALKSARGDTRMIGITMERGAAMYQSVLAGEIVAVEEEQTLADSLGGGIGFDNRYTFDLVRKLVDDYLLVSEEQIADGMRHLYWQEGIVAEGGGAVGVSALIHGLAGRLSGNVVCVVSGSNVDMANLTEIVSRGPIERTT